MTKCSMFSVRRGSWSMHRLLAGVDGLTTERESTSLAVPSASVPVSGFFFGVGSI